MICDGCTHAECCPAKEEHGGAKRCSAFKPQEMTNEEWLRNLSFNELARVLYCMIINGERIRPDLAYIKRWLKQPHQD